MSRGGTLALYIVIMLIAVTAALLSQRKIFNENGVFYKFKFRFFVISFLALWFVSAFTNIGVDYGAYIRIIRMASFNSAWKGEIGFNFLCIALNFLCGDNYDLSLFIIKTMTLMIFFRSLYLLRDHIRIGLAVFAFALMSYLRFYLISMHFAAALILLSVTYLYLGSAKKGMLFYAFAILIHYSAIFLFPMYLLFYIITAWKKKFSRLQIFLLTIGYVTVFFGIYQIYNFMVSTFSIFSQYGAYGFIKNYSGLGIMQILYYIPIFYMAIVMYRCSDNKRLVNLSIVMSITGLFYAMLGYRLDVMSRMYEHFMGLYMLCVPALFHERMTGVDLARRKFVFSYRVDLTIWTFYIVVRGIDVMNDILKISSSAKMNQWKFFFPF